jgi:5-methyltetrahydropteroyltriglutamate--homocysteine methyltransferase
LAGTADIVRPDRNAVEVAALMRAGSLKRRLEEASKFAPLEQLALSPQCGFASTEEGNILTEDEQWAKLKLAVDVAGEVWGR